MDLAKAKLIVDFLNAYESHLDKWQIVLDRQSENDRYSIGVGGMVEGRELIVIYQPASIMSLIIDRGQHWDRSYKADHPIPIREDDNLWNVLFSVYTAMKGGGWEHTL